MDCLLPFIICVAFVILTVCTLHCCGVAICYWSVL